MSRTRSVLAFVALATTSVWMGCELVASPDATDLHGTGAGGEAATGSGGQGGTGGGGASGLGGGGAQPCSDPSMCPGMDDVCETRTCIEGVCGLDFVAEGTPIPQQTAEDCQIIVCDGEGATTSQPDDTDLFDDQNPCTTDSCDAGSPVNAPLPAGDPCSVGSGVLCDGEGGCVECLVGSDCVSGACSANVCVPAECVDDLLNGTETDVDCGGDACPPCGDGLVCAVAADCVSGVCDAVRFTCTAPTCADGVANQDETDSDCGGLVCSPCATGLGCLVDGDCIGGACSGSVCLATCTDTAQNQDETDVDCGGLLCADCPNGDGCVVAADCASNLCSGTTCAACSADGDCAGNEHCTAGVCVADLGVAVPCASDGQCLTGQCEDGVCCASDCSGTCQACVAAKTGAADGTCANVSGAADPDDECATSPCTTGTCDGNAACGKLSAGTSCGSALSCSGATQTNQDVCDGGGACIDNGVTPCAPYVCGGTSCLTSCVTGVDCAAGNFCVGGLCVSSLPEGASCTLPADCNSGACVDGVCCESACSGACMACSSAKTGAADGLCAAVVGNTDPDAECAATPCTTGLCDGVGACGNLGAGAPCGDALSCAAGTQTNADSCNGSGVCSDAGTTGCGAYACGPLSCLAVCASDADCASGNFCSGGACVPQLAQGAVCATNNQCSSASCVDGFCCDSACGSTCQACSAAKTGGLDGVCAAVTNGADPDNECAATECTTDTCNGAGACGSLPAGSACGSAQACVPGLETVADMCDGAGACVDMGAKFCGAYACSGSDTCLTACTTSADCAAGLTCSAGVCSNACGDGTVGPSEACDDGAAVGGDGCSANCQVETGWTCSGAPSSCSRTQELACNDATDNDGDTLVDCADPDCALGCDAAAFAGGCPPGQDLVVAKTTGATPLVDLLNRQATLEIGASGVVRRAVVGFDISHTSASNLDITLAPPNVIAQPNSAVTSLQSQGLELSTDNGSTGDNYVATVLSDSCATLVSSGAAPFTGCFKPEYPLALATGSVARGPWRLVVFDDAAAETGTLQSFSLALCVAPCGDGVVSIGELCDDGNAVGGDGCSATCAVEAGKSCTGTPSFCTTTKESICNDGLDDDGDLLVDCADGDCALGCDATAFAGGCAAGERLVVGASTGGTVTIPDRGAFVGNLGIAQSGLVSKVALRFDIAHTNDADVDLFLVAPSAFPTEVATDNGSTGDNFTGTVLSDLCTTVISSGTAPFTGCFKPEDLMNRTIAGTNARGDWRLQAVDDATGIAGTLSSWGVAMCVATCGDGIVSSAETCDDGDANGGDGCSALCHLEAGYTCVGALCTVTSEAGCNDNGDNDGDGSVDCADPDCALGCDAAAFAGGCAPGQRLTVGRAVPLPMSFADLEHTATNVVFAGSAGVTKMATRFTMTHTFDGDLDIVLAANGQVVDLSSDNGSSADDYTSTTLSDACATSVVSGAAPFTGCFAPEDPLSSVRTTLAGPFRVDAYDDGSNDTGQITSFELAVCSSY